MFWISLTIFATLVNTVRLAFQKKFSEVANVEIATWVRYSIGLPFVVVYLVVITIKTPEYNFYGFSFKFLVYCFFGGLFQIIGNIMLVHLFSKRNFAVGVTYSNTETIQTVIFGSIFFAEYIGFFGYIAVLFGLIGVLVISITERELTIKSILLGLLSKEALLGIGSGANFAISGLFIRHAGISLQGSHPYVDAGFVLLFMVIMQIFILLVYLINRYDKKYIIQVIKNNLMISVIIAITSVISSIGFFTALIIAKAAYVKTISQIGILFSLVATHQIFKEQIKKAELIGIMMIIVSVLLLLLIN